MPVNKYRQSCQNSVPYHHKRSGYATKDAHSGLQPTIDTLFEKHRQELYELNCERLDAITDFLVLRKLCMWKAEYTSLWPS